MSQGPETSREVKKGTGIRTEPYTLDEINAAIADLDANSWNRGRHSMSRGDWIILRDGLLSEQAEVSTQEALAEFITDRGGGTRLGTEESLDRIEGAVLGGLQEISDASNQMATDPESARIIGEALREAFSDEALAAAGDEPTLLTAEPFSEA